MRQLVKAIILILVLALAAMACSKSPRLAGVEPTETSSFTSQGGDVQSPSGIEPRGDERCADPKFTGPNCDQCADPRFGGSDCSRCVNPRFAGPNCDQCANPKFAGANCDQCADPKFSGPLCDRCSDSRFSGPNCDQCADARFSGPNCDRCADSKFTGPLCNQCADGRFNGPNCDQCSDSRYSGPNCDQCADSRFTGPLCNVCADAKFTGALCNRCSDPKFTGANCDQCADARFKGPNCNECAARHRSGPNCEQCADGFTGANCDQCSDPKFTGANCDQCSDPKFTGANCDQCSDPKFTGANCNQCSDPKFTGANCDQCSNPKFTGASCNQCSDPKFTGANCDQCSDPKFTGAKCDQCSDPRRDGANCDTCKKPFGGADCSECADSRFTGPTCTTCKVELTGTSTVCPSLWTRNVVFTASTPPSANDDQSFFTANERITSVSLSGADNWDSDSFDCGRVLSPVTVHDGLAYFTCENRTLQVVKATNGTLIWSAEIGLRVTHRPAVSDDGTVFLSVNNTLFSIGDSGKLIRSWSSSKANAILTAPATDGVFAFVASSEGELCALTPSLSTAACIDIVGKATDIAYRQFPGNEQLDSIYVLTTTTVYNYPRYGTTPRATYTLTDGTFTSPMTVDGTGHVYIASKLSDGSAQLQRLHVTSWSPQFTAPLSSVVTSRIVTNASGSTFYALTSKDGMLHAFSYWGQLQWRYALRASGWGSPLLLDGGRLIVVGDNTGKLHGLRF